MIYCVKLQFYQLGSYRGEYGAQPPHFESKVVRTQPPTIIKVSDFKLLEAHSRYSLFANFLGGIFPKNVYFLRLLKSPKFGLSHPKNPTFPTQFPKLAFPGGGSNIIHTEPLLVRFTAN